MFIARDYDTNNKIGQKQTQFSSLPLTSAGKRGYKHEVKAF